MQLNESNIEYELVDILWILEYDTIENDYVSCVCEDDLAQREPTDSHAVKYDIDGIPIGNSLEEIRMRENLIDGFFRKWYSEHPAREVYNIKMNEKILVRKVSIDEAKEHAAKRYKSTLAVLKHFDEILTNAISIGKTAIKAGDRNQSRFDYMLIMSYTCTGVGTIKLTIGIRKKGMLEERATTMTQYGISALEEGQAIVVPRKSDKKKKKASR